MKVLLATDGEAPSEEATAFLARLVDPARVQVEVLSVNGFELTFRESMSLGHYSPGAGQEQAERATREAAAALAEAGIQASQTVVEGDEASEILRVAGQGGHGLVVLGTGKERWLDTVTLGSVSTSVLHAAPCPVLVVHTAPDHDGPVRVLVGTDGSEGAERALATFTGVADPARCTVEVLSAVKPTALPRGGPAGAAADDEVTDDATAAAMGHAEAGAAVLRDAGFQVTTEVVAGSPASVLLERAGEAGHDLVVVGARGLGRFKAKVLGSVSDRVVRRAPASLIGH